MVQLDLFSQLDRGLEQGGHAEVGRSTTLTIATWNVNSIRARLDLVLDWIRKRQPDVLCLQEIKVEDKGFPYEPFQREGYNAVVFGQKRYNGVAILSRLPMSSVKKGFCDDEGTEDRRVVSVYIGNLRIVSVYAPNAQEVRHESFERKVRWLERLCMYIEATHSRNEPLIVCGDFNVAPERRDVDDPQNELYETFVDWRVRKEFSRIMQWGLRDVLRSQQGGPGLFTWWDYRGNAFQQNRGMRIDHILASSELERRATGVLIDREARGAQKPSDHAPVIATFMLG